MKKLVYILILINLTGCFLFDKSTEIEKEVEDKLPTQVEVPYKTQNNKLAVWDYSSNLYKEIFLKGMNLGVGVPGTSAGHLAPDYDTYYRWFSEMQEMGVNVIRIYTLHYPRFYKAFNDFNKKNSDNPVYLFQGVWLDSTGVSDENFSLFDASDEGFSQEIEDVIDCVYGNNNIASRFGKAYGIYDVDISRWVIGWIIGREISPEEVKKTNTLVSKEEYKGTLFSIENALNSSTTWAVENIDYTATYEYENYGYQRPISLSSWPTLDPLEHDSETGYEDSEALYLGDIDMTKSKAGYFASYHAYPYYPDFMSYENEYNDSQYTDEWGQNTYLGYLNDLQDYYNQKKIPLVIAETGVPSSWGNAKFAFSGMDHGGHSEENQGKWNARIIDNVYTSGCAGALMFEWIDEWWKRAWTNDELTYPRENYNLWHDITNPEENFGMIKFIPTENEYEDIYTSEGGIKVVKSMANETYLNIKIQFENDIKRGNHIEIGFDTYNDSENDQILGKKELKNGESTSLGLEFVIEYPLDNDLNSDFAQMYVTEAYDLYGIWHNVIRPKKRFYHSQADNNGDWVTIEWLNFFRTKIYDNIVPDKTYNIGKLEVAFNESVGSKTAIEIEGNNMILKIPWTLLQFSDPSTNSVVNSEGTMEGEYVVNIPGEDSEDNGESMETEGIALVVYYNGIENGIEKKIKIETSRYSWEGWGVANIQGKYLNKSEKESKKSSYDYVKEAFEKIKD